MNIKSISLIIFFFSPILTIAQGQANNWFFGFNSGINFNVSPPSAINGSVNNTGGSACISDKNGKLLFYTDGQTVWNRNHTVMPNGTGLKGFAPYNPQPAIIIPFDEKRSSKYYIFTTDGGNLYNDSILAYSIVDMSLSGGLGDVIQKNITLLKPVRQMVAAVKHANGTDTWVLTHKLYNNSFYAFLVTACGITDTVISSLGPNEEAVSNESIKFSPDGKRVGLSLTGTFNMYIFDFDNNTGILSNPQDLGDFTGGYGPSFSPNSNLVYISNINNLKQFNLLAGSTTAITASAVTIFLMASLIRPQQLLQLQIARMGNYI